MRRKSSLNFKHNSNRNLLFHRYEAILSINNSNDDNQEKEKTTNPKFLIKKLSKENCN